MEHSRTCARFASACGSPFNLFVIHHLDFLDWNRQNVDPSLAHKKDRIFSRSSKKKKRHFFPTSVLSVRSRGRAANGFGS